MTYSHDLIEKYKQFKGITTDAEVTRQVPKLTHGNIGDIKVGKRHLNANQCIFIAEEIGIDPKEALLELAIEKSKSEKEKSILKDTLKKISAACILGIAIAAAQLSGHTVAPLSRNRRFNII